MIPREAKGHQEHSRAKHLAMSQSGMTCHPHYFTVLRLVLATVLATLLNNVEAPCSATACQGVFHNQKMCVTFSSDRKWLPISSVAFLSMLRFLSTNLDHDHRRWAKVRSLCANSCAISQLSDRPYPVRVVDPRHDTIGPDRREFDYRCRA
jgi:hypothetical protein